MAKRFTATDKWDDPWFCGLTDTDKLFWFYLLDKCDHAGIWPVNWQLVAFHIHGEIKKENFKTRIVELSEEKWFIPKFIRFQYGDLNPENKAHASVLAILKKERVLAPGQVLASPWPGPMDKDMDKDKAIGELRKVILSDNIGKTPEFCEKLIKDMTEHIGKEYTQEEKDRREQNRGVGLEDWFTENELHAIEL